MDDCPLSLISFVNFYVYVMVFLVCKLRLLLSICLRVCTRPTPFVSIVIAQNVLLLMIVDLFPFQIEIVLGKTENFDELMAAAAEEREAAEADEQS